MSNPEKLQSLQMISIDNANTGRRSALSSTISSFDADRSLYNSTTSSTGSTSSSPYPRSYHPRDLLNSFIDSFKEFDYSTLPPVYNNITDQESQLQLNPANPNFDYSHFTQLERCIDYCKLTVVQTIENKTFDMDIIRCINWKRSTYIFW